MPRGCQQQPIPLHADSVAFSQGEMPPGLQSFCGCAGERREAQAAIEALVGAPMMTSYRAELASLPQVVTHGKTALRTAGGCYEDDDWWCHHTLRGSLGGREGLLGF